MRGIVVTPGVGQSVRLVGDLPEPPVEEGPVLVEALSVGVCGTDREIIAGEYGSAPAGHEVLVLGHESLGRVVSDATGTFAVGDLVAGIVRQPDPVPCVNCAAGEWDMCRNGRYTEHGIKGLDGFARERWRSVPDHLVLLDESLRGTGMLLEPASVVAKGWEHIGRIGARAHFAPRVALIAGAGPIGLLAALMARQRGLETHVLDRVPDGPKPDLVAALGATYHTGKVCDVGFEPDIIVECTGVAAVVMDSMEVIGPDGIVCLTGVSAPGKHLLVDGGAINRALVLENNVVFGTVNANRRHWQLAAGALLAADPHWLAGLISRRVPLADFADAYLARPDDVKVVLDLAA